MKIPADTGVTQSNEAPSAGAGGDAAYRALAEAITDYAIYMLDPEGLITSWNAGAQRFKGCAAAEVPGSHFSRFHTEEDRLAGKPEADLARRRQEGRFEDEGWRMRKGGSRFRAGVVIDAIKDCGGKTIGFAKITRDITDKRTHEQSLKEARKLEALGQLTGGRR